jgi:predicted ATPase/class 3 adenylate cyclase
LTGQKIGSEALMGYQTLPTGTVTFLFTDIEGSTRLWEQAPEQAMQALVRHDEIIEGEVTNRRGAVVRPRGEGDSRFAVFPLASDALAAAAAIQRQFYSEHWPTPRPLKIRMALHTGEADLRMGDYYGPAVNRCARLRGIAHGGQTLLSRATWELVHDALPAGASLLDEGEHRLKDLTHPEHVFQLLLSDLPQDYPPLRSLSTIPNNLPIQLTEFIGREEAAEEIQRLLEGTRLLTLVGPGGIGKTRLAIETAANLSDRFRHGVFFISLAPVPSTEFVAQTIAEGIGLSLASNEAPRQQLLNYLRSKQELLVVDNFEHVLGAAGLVDEILRGAAEVKILATSRIRLNLNGETVYAVAGLSANGRSSPGSYLESEAARLFLATAQRSRPGFEVGKKDLQPLLRILRLVEGSPLGILLAAAWVDVLTVGEIAEEIAENFDFLETDMANMPERQRSVRAAFDYSWRLLSQPERELFSALSVFRGGFTRQAAQAVAGASLRQLANLANKSFLNTSPETGRYFVHELLRQYGEEALREDEARYETVKSAHDGYFAAFMEQAWHRITHDEQREALLEIEADVENVRTAWRHLAARGEPTEALRMVRSLWFVHDLRGWHIAGVEIFGEAVRAANSRPGSDSGRILAATCESARGFFEALLGRVDASLALAERSTETLRELGASEELAFAVCQMCMGLYLTARLSRLREAGQEALEISADPWTITCIQIWIAFADYMEGNFEGSDRRLDLAQNILGTVQDYWMLYWLHLCRSLSFSERGDFAAARAILEQALTNVSTVNMRRGILYTLYNLGLTAIALEDFTSAQGYLVESMRVSEELGSTREIASALVDLAVTWSASGEVQKALELAATASAHPLSDQNTIWNIEPVRDRAAALRSSLEGAITPEAAQAAWQRGEAANFERVVAGLIEG